MSKKKVEQPEILESYIKAKDEFKEQYQRKKVTQQNAKQRRQFIRERIS